MMLLRIAKKIAFCELDFCYLSSQAQIFLGDYSMLTLKDLLEDNVDWDEVEIDDEEFESG